MTSNRRSTSVSIHHCTIPPATGTCNRTACWQAKPKEGLPIQVDRTTKHLNGIEKPLDLIPAWNTSVPICTFVHSRADTDPCISNASTVMRCGCSAHPIKQCPFGSTRISANTASLSSQQWPTGRSHEINRRADDRLQRIGGGGILVRDIRCPRRFSTTPAKPRCSNEMGSAW